MFLCKAVCWVLVTIVCSANEYVIDNSVGHGRRFDGVGAISGGGATSKLLVNYPQEQRSAILDFLFKPNFGASLHILKVEIGGDAQSSEGTESSHMHEPWDENYRRGYQWWMMTEAKKRNPDILLCGLSWGYPGWLSREWWDPYDMPNRTADYIVRWVAGAKNFYNLDIDYVGIWNEKPYNIEYIKTLRRTLDSRGFQRVRIIAADLLPSDAWVIVDDLLRDAELFDAVDIVGGHYTGSYTTHAARNCSKPLWSSEDYSANYHEEGAGCLARLLNQNYVVGKMTSTIAWNLINSYYDDLPYPGASLMKANQPWSGYYEVGPPIWAAAHTTQFVKVGWHYLQDRSGVHVLCHGGSLVSLVSPDDKDLTVVIETMDTSSGQFCPRPPALPTHVKPQNITLVLKGSFAGITSLNLWQSTLHNSNATVLFHNAGSVAVNEGRVTLMVEVNSVYTLTTLQTGQKGTAGKIPLPADFPLPYKDNFDGYADYQEAYNFAQQTGAFEVQASDNVTHGKVLRQVVLRAPVHWCPIILSQPVGVIGNYQWSDVRVVVDVLVPTVNASNGVFVAARVDQGGCTSFLARGVFFFVLFRQHQVVVATDLERTQTVFTGLINLQHDRWFNISLSVKGQHVLVSVGGSVLYKGDIEHSPTNGFVAFGTDGFGLADFDNFEVLAS